MHIAHGPIRGGNRVKDRETGTMIRAKDSSDTATNVRAIMAAYQSKSLVAVIAGTSYEHSLGVCEVFVNSPSQARVIPFILASPRTPIQFSPTSTLPTYGRRSAFPQRANRRSLSAASALRKRISLSPLGGCRRVPTQTQLLPPIRQSGPHSLPAANATTQASRSILLVGSV